MQFVFRNVASIFRKTRKAIFAFNDFKTAKVFTYITVCDEKYFPRPTQKYMRQVVTRYDWFNKLNGLFAPYTIFI